MSLKTLPETETDFQTHFHLKTALSYQDNLLTLWITVQASYYAINRKVWSMVFAARLCEYNQEKLGGKERKREQG